MRCWSCERENAPGVRYCAACGAGVACPGCGGPLSGGQRFCTRCGRRLPVRGAQTVIRKIERRIQETPHFRIYYASESYAEQQMGTIAGRLEAAYGSISAALGLQQARGQAQITVHLVEFLEPLDGLDIPSSQTGFLLPDKNEFHEIYRSDAPGVTLERWLAHLLLLSAVGRADIAPFILQGGLTWLSGRLGADFSGVDALLADLRAQGQLPLAMDLVTGPAPGMEGYYAPVSGAFTGYLVERFGLPKYLEFARRLDPSDPNVAAQAAFGARLERIGKDWQKTVKTLQPGGVFRFIKASGGQLRPYSFQVFEILVYIGVSVAFTAILPLAQRRLTDKVFVPATLGLDPSHNELYKIIGAIVALFVVASIMSLRQEFLTAFVTERVLRDMRIRVFSIFQRMEPAFFQRYQTGDLMSRMSSDLLSIQFAYTGAMAEGLRLVLTLLVALGTIFYLDWKLAAIAVAGMPLFFLTTKFLGPPAARASFQRQQDLASASSALQENLAAQPVVKGFGLERMAIAGYRAQLEQLLRSSRRLSFLSSLYGLSANSLASGIQLMVLGIGGYLLLEGDLSIGTLGAFLTLLAQLIGPVQSLSAIMQALQQATGAMDRVDELLNQQPAIEDTPGARAIPRLREAIRLENVTLSYTGQQANLDDVTLTIPAGKKVAFVGPSGSGKSTTLNVITRFYDPNNGRITFDGVDLREATLESVRGQMAIVFQDNFLFNVSVRENIRMGREGASDAEVEEAAKAAEIHDLILQLPEGYDTIVGERGGRLSGGQRQRVAIARAIIRNPAILILDEATSALDARTEAAINKTLDRISTGRTTIAVTHRLTSAAQMDLIFVLDQGKLVEQGSHDELLRRDGLYARLWQEQTGGLGDGLPDFGGAQAVSLSNVALFSGVDGDLIAALANRMGMERFAPGDVIINQGERGDTMYIIQRGGVEILHTDQSGVTRRVNELGPGDYFGEIALLYDVPRIASVRATQPSLMLTLSRGDLEALTRSVPDLRGSLEQTVAQRAQMLGAR